MRKYLVIFFITFWVTSLSFSQGIPKLNFVGKIQCVNSKTGKLKAEYTILQTTEQISFSIRNLAKFFDIINKQYWLTQTQMGNCSITDDLNVFIEKPVDALVLLKTLIDIYNFKYTINANLAYKPSYILIKQTNLSLKKLFKLLIQEYIYKRNKKLSILVDINSKVITLSERKVKSNLKLENYVDLLKNGTYQRYLILFTVEGIQLKPYKTAEESEEYKESNIQQVCSSKKPVARLFLDNTNLVTVLKVFEKLFHLKFIYRLDEINKIKHSQNIHLFLKCLDKQKALDYLKRNFHLYFERIDDTTYRIFNGKDSYDLLASQLSSYKTKVLYLKNIDVNEFVNTLHLLYGNKVVYTVDLLFNAVTITAPAFLIKDILHKFKAYIREEQDFERLMTKIFYVKYGQLSEVAGKVKEYLSDKGYVKVLNEAQALQITDYPTNISIIEKVFGKFLSQKPIKIKVTAKFVRISKTFARSLGINWEFTYGSNTKTESVASWHVTQEQGSLTSNIQFIYKKFNPINLILGAGETVGLSKVLSSPSLILLPNQAGNISFGTQIPYQSVDENGNPKTELVAATLTLNVAPQLLPDGRILLKLNLSNNAPNTALAVNGQPAIDTFTITQNFIVSNGDTIIIGGVLKKEENEGESGVPILRKIPLLGWLFKNKNWSNSDTEMYVIITARLVTQ